MKGTRLARTAQLACLIALGCHNTTAVEENQTVSVSISPPPGAIAQCGSVLLHAVAQDGTGAAVTPDSVRWRSSNSVAGPISAGGLLTGLQPTPADTITVTVFALGAPHQAQAIWPIYGDLTGGCH